MIEGVLGQIPGRYTRWPGVRNQKIQRRKKEKAES